MRSLQHLNKAVIANLQWNFMEDTDCHWIQLRRAKCLLNVRHDMKEGCCWSVGTGEHINIWYDLWVSQSPNEIPEFNPSAANNSSSSQDLTEWCFFFKVLKIPDRMPTSSSSYDEFPWKRC